MKLRHVALGGRRDRRRAPASAALLDVGHGAQGTVNGSATDGTHTTNTRVYGSAAGLDVRLAPNTKVGMSLGGGTVSYGLADGMGSGSSDMLHAGVFGVTRQGATYASAALAYGWFGGNSERTVSVAGVDRLKSNTSAHDVAVRLETGLRLPVTDAAAVNAAMTPYAAFQAQRLDLGSTGEQTAAGASPFALSFGNAMHTMTRTEVGARFSSSTVFANGIGLKVQSRAAWVHDFDTDIAIGASFQSLPGAAFTVAGARAAPDGALFSAGAELQLTRNVSLGANFDDDQHLLGDRERARPMVS